MLTSRQIDLLTFIDQHIKTTGGSPSYTEMQIATKAASKAGVHRLVTALIERGFIHRRPNRARALTVLKLPGTPLTDAERAEMSEADRTHELLHASRAQCSVLIAAVWDILRDTTDRNTREKAKRCLANARKLV